MFTMKYTTTTLFTAAAALASIASASTATVCNEPAPGEPAVCQDVPVTPPVLESDGGVRGDYLPCVEVVFKDNECYFDSARALSVTMANTPYSEGYPAAFAACNCGGNVTFNQWLECQNCMIEHGFTPEADNLWLQILAKAKSALCNMPQKPFDALLPSPVQTDDEDDDLPAPTTTPTPSITTLAPSTTEEPATITPALIDPHCSQEAGNRQDTIIPGPTVTETTLTAPIEPTDTPMKEVLPLPPVVETSNAISSFEKSGLVLAIVGGLVLGVL